MAAQAAPAPVRLEYVVAADDPGLLAAGKLQLTWKASGFRDRITSFCLQTDRHEYEIDPASFTPLGSGAGQWEDHPLDEDKTSGKPRCSEGFRAVVKGIDSVQATFTIAVNRPAYSPCRCEFNSYLGAEWGVIKAEALAIPFSFAYFGDEPVFQAQVRFVVLDGWNAEAPWTKISGTLYSIPGSPPLPRGFFVLGRFTPEHRDETASIGKEFVYVRLAQELRTKDSLFEYLKKATPYYQSVYGNVTGNRILVVSAGAPMFTGGLGSTDSLFVHQNSSLDTIAHEYAHVWQRFQTIDRCGDSSIWLNEGDADLHGALSRFVTETQAGFTLQQLNQEMKQSYDGSAPKAEYQRPLTAAQYGGAATDPCYEQVAYKKGMFTLIFLDQEMRRVTNNATGLNDLLRELNAEYDANISTRSGEKRMSNADALRVVNRVVQRAASVDMTPFWDRYVTGPCGASPLPSACWPPYRELPAEVPLVYDELRLSPGELTTGSALTVRVSATNVRPGPETRPVEFFIDDKLVERRNVTVGGLHTVTLTFTTRAPAPGDHTARVAYLRQDFHVQTLALLTVEGLQPLTAPQVGVAFPLAVSLRNSGETGTQASVDVVLGAVRRSAQVDVPAGGTGTARMSFTILEQGLLAAEVEVHYAGNQSVTASGNVLIGPRDRDSDGVPDDLDAYPDNPALSEKNVVNDARNAVPGPDMVTWVLAAAAGVALHRRQRRRRP